MLDIIDQCTNKGVNVIENVSFENFGNFWQKGNGMVIGHGFDTVFFVDGYNVRMFPFYR
jgi:hypothetical protein